VAASGRAWKCRDAVAVDMMSVSIDHHEAGPAKFKARQRI
jgi:hypothetical protein